MDNTFDDFIAAVPPRHQDFVKATHEKLVSKGYKIKIESKASGLFVSYSNPKTKRSTLNFLFRKSGLFLRFYPAETNVCTPDSMTDVMEKELAKAADCKRCSDKCIKGYKFSLGGQAYDKCRYNAFLFAVSDESKSVLDEWIQREVG